MQTALPTAFHVTTPHGEIGLWWLALSATRHEAQGIQVRQQAAQILNRQFPASSLGQIHWPPGAQHPPDLAYAAQAWHAPTSSPDLWLSWSYVPMPDGQPGQALLAIGPLPLGVAVTASGLHDQAGWETALARHDGPSAAPLHPHAAALRWTALVAADKCRHHGLRPWSTETQRERQRCSTQTLPLPSPDLVATLAWMAPGI